MRLRRITRRCNEKNVSALFACALPYHATNEFVRLVQTMHIGHGAWSFLRKMQETGASMPRDALVKRCLADKATLAFVCDTAKRMSAPHVSNRTYLSFYAVLACELVAAEAHVSQDLLSRLLPHLLDGLKASHSPDYQAATLMVVAQLCRRAPLSQDLVSGQSVGQSAGAKGRVGGYVATNTAQATDRRKQEAAVLVMERATRWPPAL